MHDAHSLYACLFSCFFTSTTRSFLFPRNSIMIKQPLVAREDVVSFSALDAVSVALKGLLLQDSDSTLFSQYQSRQPEAGHAATVYAARLCHSTHPKMIVFDKDGTLGDCSGSLRRWVMHMTARVQSILRVESEVEMETVIHEFYDHIGWDVTRDNVVPSAPVAAGTWDDILSIVVDFLASIQSRLTVNGTLDLVKQWHHEMGDLHGQDAPIIDDLKSMMIACQDMGYLVAVCTSDDRPATDAAMNAWGIDKVVNVSICGNEVAVGKPSPLPLYDLCCKTNQYLRTRGGVSQDIHPQDCIMVGDTTADTGMAKSANVGFCVGVLSGSGTSTQLLGTGAHIVVPDVGHIPALLEVLEEWALHERPTSERR
jgi:phosphoglycolate phosphatase-like HAD superfamily hydrolase